MDPRIDRIEEKLDRIVDTQGEMRADLQEHMRRTEIAEENVERLAMAMAPVQEHVATVRALTRLLSAALALAGVVAAFLAIRK